MSSEFHKYRPYVRSLVRMANNTATTDTSLWQQQLTIALNGQAGDVLQSCVAARTRRKHGTFFTGHTLAEKLVNRYKCQDLRDTVWLDPTVGGSDLLIAVARLIGKAATYEATLDRWNEQLLGLDLQPEFIEASKARLVLLARLLHDRYATEPVIWSRVLPCISTGNALTDFALYERATHLVMNPPFAKMDAPKGCKWANGKVNAAAVFMETAVRHARPGAEIVAILPEVLRAGTRYEKWQQEITKHAQVISVNSEGLFHNADVDVFSLMLRKRKKSIAIGRTLLPSKREKTLRLGDLFKVSVGAVVPYRAPNAGPTYRYIHPKNATAWARLARATEWRKFSGTVFQPPFVVIRRTSRPGDKHRAIASLVTGRKRVAVENHLIVCQPKDGQIATCEMLLPVLRMETTDQHFDMAIRCRHLTVTSVRQMPM